MTRTTSRFLLRLSLPLAQALAVPMPDWMAHGVPQTKKGGPIR